MAFSLRFQQIRRQRVIRIAPQARFGAALWPSPSCPAQDAPAPAETTPSSPAGTANRHRTAASSAARWRSNQFSPASFGAFAHKPAGRGKVFSPLRAGQVFPSDKRGVISHFAEGADAHFLKIAFEVRGREPMLARGFCVTERGAGAAEPVMNVALVGQQMFGFAQIARRSQRAVRNASARAAKSLFRQRGAAQAPVARERAGPAGRLRRLPTAETGGCATSCAACSCRPV